VPVVHRSPGTSSGRRACASAPSRYQPSRVRTAKLCRLWGIPHNRHTFAVNTLLDAYESGADPGERIPLLATYLGHTEPANTYWYLHACPELLTAAANRVDHHLATVTR